MASSPSIPAASAAPVISKSAQLQCQRQSIHSCLSFPHSLKPSLLFLASSQAPQGSHQARCAILKAQLNEVSLQGLSNASVTSTDKLDASKPRTEDVESARPSFPSASVSDSTLSDFMAEVANLVKLVDSRDIIELQLKQNDCELIIKKKEALPQLPISAPMVAVQTPTAQSVPPSHLHPPAAAPSPAPSTASVPSLPSPAVKSSHSSHPPLKCPMAGTFYRSPGPGEPPFVKVGDKVKKGQVLCIIEAMKLMNEIEADQSGTLVEVLVDDGKPVSVDMPLFVIEP